MEVYVENLPAGWQAYNVLLVVENTVGCDVDDVSNVHLAANGRTAIVEISRLDEASAAEETLEWSKVCEGAVVSMRKCPYCIEVHGLHDPLTDEVLRIYFENRRHGGQMDGVSYVRNHPEQVVIGFKRQQVRREVLAHERHRIAGQPVQVYACDYPPATEIREKRKPAEAHPGARKKPPPTLPKPGKKRKTDLEIPRAEAEETSSEVAREKAKEISGEVAREEAKETSGGVAREKAKETAWSVPEVKVPEITKELKPMPVGKYNFLKAHIQDIPAAKSVKLEVETRNEDVVLTLTGTAEAIMTIMEALQDIREGAVGLSANLIQLLKHGAALQELRRRLREKHPTAEVRLSGSGNLRLATHNDAFYTAEKEIQSFFTLTRVNYTGTVEDLEALRHLIEAHHLVTITHDVGDETVALEGFSDTVASMETTLMRFNREKTVTEEVGPLSHGVYALLQDAFKEQLAADVSLLPETRSDDVVLRLKGLEQPVTSSAADIRALVDSVSRSELRVPDYVITLVGNDHNLQELKKRFLDQRHQFCATVDRVDPQNNRLYALCKSSDLTRATDFANAQFCQETLVLADSAKVYAEGEEWQTMKEMLQKLGQVVIEQSASEIKMSGFREAVRDSRSSVEAMLKGKHEKTEVVGIANRGEYRFINQHLRSEVDNIQDKCKGVTITFVEKDPKDPSSRHIKVKGQVKGVDKAVQMLNELRDTIHKDILDSKNYGMATHFQQGTGEFEIQRVERKCPVTVDVQTTTSVAHAGGAVRGVRVRVGDLVSSACEALVCSVANGEQELARCGAVAAAFAQKGGDGLQNIFSALGGVAEGKVHKAAGTGNIRCSAILFLGARDWNGDSSKQMLQTALAECLRLCKSMGLTSMALPTIGCGKMGYPPAELANCIRYAARLHPDVNMTVVAYAGDATFDSLKAALQDPSDPCSGDDDEAESAAPRGAEGAEDEWEDIEDEDPDEDELADARYEEVEYDEEPAKAPTPVAVTNVTVTVGDITQVQSHVLVITLGSCNASLGDCGEISKAFARAVGGGTALQEDFDAVGNGGLALGKVAVSKLQNVLKCKRLLYFGLDKWRGDKTAKVVTSGIESCLIEAQALQMSTIAFPALGTGNLGFPPAEVAKCFIQAAQKFPQMQIQVVSFKKDATFSALTSVIQTGSVTSGPKLQNLHLHHGDITKMKCDVLVNSLGKKHKELKECGEIAKAFLNVVGPQLQADFEKTDGLDTGKVAACQLPPQQLPCKKLLHLGLEKWGTMTKAHLTQGIRDCLTYTQDNQHGSIAFPALGTGNLKTPASELADCFLECAARYPQLQIHVVVYKPDATYTELERKFQAQPKPQPQPQPQPARTKLHNVHIQHGDITKVKADVLVNSVANANADLTQTGEIGKAFAAAGGKTFTDFFQSKGGLDEGKTLDYAQDTGGLNCQLIVTVSIRSWKEGHDKILMRVLEECFHHVSQNKLKSIALPTLGCGNLHYPLAKVIDCFHKVAAKHQNVQVYIISYKKDAIFKAFMEAFAGGPTTTASRAPMPSTLQPSFPSMPDLSKTATSASKRSRPDSMRSFATIFRHSGIPIGMKKSSTIASLRPQLPRPSVLPPTAATADAPPPNVTFTVYGATPAVTSNAKSELQQLVTRAYREVTVDSGECDALHYLAHLPAVNYVNFQKQLQQWRSDLALATYDLAAKQVRVIGESRAVDELRAQVRGALQSLLDMVDARLLRKVKGDDEYFRRLSTTEFRSPKSWTKYGDLGHREAVIKVSRQSGHAALTGDQFMADVDSATSTLVSQLVEKSWDLSQKITVTKVQRVENPKLYHTYMSHLKNLFGRVSRIKSVTASGEAEVHTATLGLDKLHEDLHREVNEYLFFHGTNEKVAVAVGAQGLESRFSNDGYFGKGIYLAEMAAKSHQYTSSSKRMMFIVRAPLGNIYVSPNRNTSLVRPPCKECSQDKCMHSDFHDSVLGKHGSSSSGNFKYREFILYENGLCYPVYCVTYTVQ